MAPEYQFPTASEDVAAVYKALLRKYRAQNIGIYGCSAGSLLAAEALAWFQTYVPERTLHNWQNIAARLIAQNLRENWQ